MPIYEYHCSEHGVFEHLSQVIRNEWDTQFCPECNAVCDSIVSLASMQPDKYWHGGFTPNGRYVQSTAEYAKAMNGIEPDTEANRTIIRQQKAAKKQALLQKQEKALDKFVQQELAGVTIDPDYNHLPGKRLTKQSKFK